VHIYLLREEVIIQTSHGRGEYKFYFSKEVYILT